MLVILDKYSTPPKKQDKFSKLLLKLKHIKLVTIQINKHAKERLVWPQFLFWQVFVDSYFISSVLVVSTVVVSSDPRCEVHVLIVIIINIMDMQDIFFQKIRT